MTDFIKDFMMLKEISVVSPKPTRQDDKTETRESKGM